MMIIIIYNIHTMFIIYRYMILCVYNDDNKNNNNNK